MAGRAQNSAKGTLQKDRIILSGPYGFTANSTGIVFENYEADLPGAVDNGRLIGLISNSTGVALFINTTGTTHKYVATTTKFPT